MEQTNEIKRIRRKEKVRRSSIIRRAKIQKRTTEISDWKKWVNDESEITWIRIAREEEKIGGKKNENFIKLD